MSDWREILIALLLCVVAGGIALWPKSAGTATTVNKTQVVTRTVAADGTITEHIVTKDVANVSNQSKYRVGIAVNPLNVQHDQSITAGVRLGELPLWLQGSYEIQQRAGTIGFSLDF